MNNAGTVRDFQPNERFTRSHKYVIISPSGKPIESAVSLVRGLRGCGILGKGYTLRENDNGTHKS